MGRALEDAQLRFLLNSGEWGEIAGSIEELKEKKRQLDEMDNAFWTLFGEVEEKRLVAFKKRLAALKVGICQIHWQAAYKKDGTYEIFPADMFPLEQLKVVSSPEFNCAGITVLKMMCDKCAAELPSHYKAEVRGIPTPEESWRALSDKQREKLEFHFRMPNLRRYVQFAEAEEKKG